MVERIKLVMETIVTETILVRINEIILGTRLIKL